jgi:hydroxymethylbilane synthase
MTSRPILVIGTRGSPLALAQAHLVQAALVAAEPALAAPEAIGIRVIRTTGDHVLDRTLAEIGGKGLFTKEIEEALLAREIDVAVHSFKDMATELPPGLIAAACLPRADPRDVLISYEAGSIAALAEGAVVGTASLRRGAQLLALRPDLRVVPLRGNVQARLRKLKEGEVRATFLAQAGLLRLGMKDIPATPLAPEEMLPAVAQGAICMQAREGDRAVLDRLARIAHAPTMRAAEAERAFLRVLDGSCRTPIAAFCELDGDAVRLRGLVATPDGRRVLRAERRGAAADAVALARDAGHELRARQDDGEAPVACSSS